MYIYIYFLLSFIVYSIQVFLVPCYFRSIFVMRSQDISLYYIFTYFSGLLGFWFFFFFLNLRVLFKKFDVYKYLISYFFENRILILIFISISIYFPMFFFFFPFSLYIRGIDGILEILERIQNSGIKGGDERERERGLDSQFSIGVGSQASRYCVERVKIRWIKGSNCMSGD